MNIKSLFAVWIVGVAVGTHAQPGQTTAPDLNAPEVRGKSLDYQVTERGPNSRVWSSVSWTTNRDGVVRQQTNVAYCELATGMHHLVGEQWVESNPRLQISSTGAEATNAAHQVRFLGNANTAGAVDVITPEGQHLTSSVLGLSYFDTASGQSVMIGQITNCQGQLLPSGVEGLYPNAFSGVNADLLYVNQISGVEQFVVLREQLPSPAAWELNPATTVLELITEFTEAPTPQISMQASGGAVDQELNFGAMRMTRGYAFALGASTNKVRVTKQWLLMDGRRCLVEQVPFKQIEAQLSALPASSSEGASLKASPGSVLHRVASRQLLPERKRTRNATSSFAIAKAPVKAAGFVLDYTLSGTQSNFTFKCDTTYYVTNAVNLYGKTVIEGGTVVKFGTSVNGQISINDSNVVCQTGAYRPAIFTAKDDNSVGDTISGSSGNPSGYYGGDYALSINYPVSLLNLRFFKLATALSIGGDGIFNLYDCQFVNCGTGVSQAAPSAQINIYNVLFSGISACFYYPITTDGARLHCENITMHNSLLAEPEAGYDLESDYSIYKILIANSLLVQSGVNSGIETINTETVVSDSGVFQTVGSGAYYLAAGSPYRNAGTTNSINATMLAAIRQKTTYPPIVYSNAIITVDTVFAPQAQRDTDAVDLGYHYDPLDYAFKILRITNATVRLVPGTAIGVIGSYGIAVWNGAQFISQGAPTALNHLARYNLVQECSNTNWAGAGDLVDGNWLGGGIDPQVVLRFTDCSIPAQDGYHFQNSWGNTILTSTDSQFHAGKLFVGGYNCLLTNNLLERVGLRFTEDANDIYPIVRNCLFYGGSLFIDNFDETTWIFRDNLFDHTSLPTNAITGLDADYNGYALGSDRFYYTTNSHDVVTNLVYQTGPLGSYYLTNTSAFIDHGSTTANLVGLYHYTTQTNQTTEITSTVDIGFHYVALDGNNNPIDTDGDGFPNYLEDLNGNGSVDSGETDWQSASDLGLTVLITRPKNNSVIP